MMPLSAITLHGVFMEVLGVGVLICGASGAGKGELALELVARGHRLVADDVPEFSLKSHAIIGMCPPLLQNYLEVRELGVLNIFALFGSSAICSEAQLELIVRIEPTPRPGLHEIGGPLKSACLVLGVGIPEATLHILPGRNLALLLECLVRNYCLQLQGHDTAHEFTRLHAQALATGRAR